jgi:hypothetical protein
MEIILFLSQVLQVYIERKIDSKAESITFFFWLHTDKLLPDNIYYKTFFFEKEHTHFICNT